MANKVDIRSKNESYVKFYFASKKISSELKAWKIFLYLLNVIPVVIYFIDTSEGTYIKLICSLSSFALTLINEFIGGSLANFKEQGILLNQLYESEITGSQFAKIEYDREVTNDLQELGIRKGLRKISKNKPFPNPNVPSEVSDDYSYLYICRKNAATIRYQLSRYSILMVLYLISLSMGLFYLNFALGGETDTLVYLVVCFWSLITPVIRNITRAKKSMKLCMKLSSDIDSFFADGDDSVQRLARFYYYVQNLEYEMLVNKPMTFNTYNKFFSRGVNILQVGVTKRFIESINELKVKALVNKQPNIIKTNIITKSELTEEEIRNKITRANNRKLAAKKAAETAKTTIDNAPTQAIKKNTATRKTAESSTKKAPAVKVANRTTTTKKAVTSTVKKASSTTAKKATPTKSTTKK